MGATLNNTMDRALERVRHWSAERQQDAAELLLARDAMGDDPVEVDAETLAALDEACAQVARGDIVPAENVARFFARF